MLAQVLDLRNNSIAHLPYEVMDAGVEGLQLQFGDNPCAEEVDWSGLGVDRLPVRMGGGFDNGGFEQTLKVLKLAHNELDEWVFFGLAAGKFANVEELDMSWNQLRSIGVSSSLERLRKLDVSGHGETIDAM